MKLDSGMLTHDLKTLPDYAHKVEAMGYDCLWSAETQHDPFPPLAVAATVTSTIKLGTNIAGLHIPTSGRIVFGGGEITGLAPEVINRRGFAKTFQITHIFPGISVCDKVRVAAESRVPVSGRLPSLWRVPAGRLAVLSPAFLADGAPRATG
jgi:hypothetical protein